MCPNPVLAAKYSYLRYAKRVVGIERFWNARQNNVAVDMVIRLPLLPNVSTQDIAILQDGNQYSILQIQHITKTQPPYMDLSLERRVDAYDIASVPDSDSHTAGID